MKVDITYTIKGSIEPQHKIITLPNHYITYMVDNSVKETLIKELIEYDFTTEYHAI